MKPVNNLQSNWYHETSDVQYHKHVFSDDPFVRSVIARGRAKKLQPLLNADDRVLEYGVGIGLNLRDLRCRERTGYDLSGYGRSACEEGGIKFTNDLGTLSGKRFSVVLCHHVLEHVPGPLESLREIRELLEPGGRLILCVPFERGRHFLHHDPNDINRHLYSWNPLSLGNLLAEAGFETRTIGLGPYGYEQRLAPLAKAGFAIYRLGLALARMLRPVKEIIAIAHPRDA
jgi:2-polyprenyl-3-methyl-5-hydroxy-6-metoxy-1,4-benzoquinol methylase